MVGCGLLDDGLKLREIGWANDRVHTLLKCLHRVEGLAGAANQNRDGVAPLVHRHLLELFQRQIFGSRAGSKQLFDYDNPVLNAPKTQQKIFVVTGGVDLVTHFVQNLLGRGQPFEGAERQQGWLVRA